jgi:hypothetical protein
MSEERGAQRQKNLKIKIKKSQKQNKVLCKVTISNLVSGLCLWFSYIHTRVYGLVTYIHGFMVICDPQHPVYGLC